MFPLHLRTSNTLTGVSRDDLDEAVTILAELDQMTRRIYGPAHPFSATIQCHLKHSGSGWWRSTPSPCVSPSARESIAATSAGDGPRGASLLIHYHEDGFDPGYFVPYAVELDNGECVYAPVDSDDDIREWHAPGPIAVPSEGDAIITVPQGAGATLDREHGRATLLDPGAGGPRRRRALPGPCGLGEQNSSSRRCFPEYQVLRIRCRAIDQSRPISPRPPRMPPAPTTKRAKRASRSRRRRDRPRERRPRRTRRRTRRWETRTHRLKKESPAPDRRERPSTVARADASSAVSAVSRGENGPRAQPKARVRSVGGSGASACSIPPRSTSAAAQHTKRRGAGARRRRRTAPSASTA